MSDKFGTICSGGVMHGTSSARCYKCGATPMDSCRFENDTAEITRLRSEVERLQEQITEIPTLCRRYEHQIEQLKASAGLPGELVERIRLCATFWWEHGGGTYDLLVDILAWHEQQTGEKA